MKNNLLKITFAILIVGSNIFTTKAGVKKLNIGHFSSRYQDIVAHSNEASTIFSNTILAEDGMVVRL
jgi:ribonuclease BN (tRNA processing enzyme)